MLNSKTKLKLIFLGIIFLTLPLIVNAQTIGQQLKFYIDPSYDLQGRQELTATLVKITNQLYFYVDSDWWAGLDASEKMKIDNNLYSLVSEFEHKIYPTLTSTFGSIPAPLSGKDERISVLLHPMIQEAGGYFNSGDVYSKFQYPKSNERNILYLNSRHIDSPLAKSFLAHEFVHLITVNQKDLLRNIAEEIWLNEVRAEYALTLLGYDNVYKGSNLEKRVKAFLEKPTDSLTEWLNKGQDYGVVNLFAQYLVDHYGKKILIDSLQSSKIGIESLNYALEKNGFKINFSQIFVDWLITLLVNNCNLGKRYCYLNENLKDLRIVPTFYYLPKEETIISAYHNTTYWGLNWYRFIGGGNEVSLEFDGADQVEFEVPYLLCDLQNICSVGFLVLDAGQKGKLSLSQFNTKYNSLTIVPFVKSKISGFNGKENTFSFSWKILVNERTQTEAELRNQLLAQIAQLQAQVQQLQAKLSTIQKQKIGACAFFENNLYYGMMNNPEVRCLQEFLKTQGPEIYPEGLITGNFLSLTKKAVIRFQEKYALEILTPLGLEKGTGYLGEKTRAKINQLIKQLFTG